MRSIIAPETGFHLDSFAPEQVGEFSCVLQTFVFPGSLSDHDSGIGCIVQRNAFILRIQFLQICERVVDMKLFCITAVIDIAAHIIQTRQSQQPTEPPGMAEKPIDRMIGAHARPHHHERFCLGLPCFPQRRWNEFIEHIAVPGLQPVHAAFCRPEAAPRFCIHRIHRQKLNPSFVDQSGNQIEHPSVLPFKEPAILAGYHQAQRPGMSIQLEFHLAAKNAAVFFVISHLHNQSPIR